MKYATLLLILATQQACGQSAGDTIYFDSGWHRATRDAYEYYRTAEKKSDVYHVHDHFKDGAVQMEGTFSSLDPEMRNGFFTYYFDSGRKLKEGEFYNNKKHGTWRTYEESTGRMVLREEYKNDLHDGKTILYAPDGMRTITTFQNGVMVRTVTNMDSVHETAGAAQASGVITSYSSTSHSPQQDSLKRKIKLLLPDSLRSSSGTVVIDYELDTMAQLINIKVKSSPRPGLTDIVMTALRQTKHTKPFSFFGIRTQTTYSVSVRFPELIITDSSNSSTNMGETMQKFQKYINSPEAAALGQKLLSALGSAPEQVERMSKYFRAEYAKIKPVDLQGSIALVKLTFTRKDGGQPTEVAVVMGEPGSRLTKFAVKAIKEYTDWNDQTSMKGKIVDYTLSISFPTINVSCVAKQRY